MCASTFAVRAKAWWRGDPVPTANRAANGGLLVACGAVVAMALLLVSVGGTLLLGGRASSWHALVFVAGFATVVLFANPGTPGRSRIALLLTSSIVGAAFFWSAGEILDVSADGQTGHLATISHLAHGWNPVHDPGFSAMPADYVLSPERETPRLVPGGDSHWTDPALRLDKGPLAPQLLGAVAMLAFGDAEHAKGFNLLLIAASIVLVGSAARELGHGRRTALWIGLVAGLNPIAIVQAMTTYGDGQLASLVTCVIALAVLTGARPCVLHVMAWASVIALLCPVKSSGLFLAGGLGVVALLYMDGTGRPVRRACWGFLGGAFVGVGVAGYWPYVRNLVHHGTVLDLGWSAGRVVGTYVLALLAGVLFLWAWCRWLGGARAQRMIDRVAFARPSVTRAHPLAGLLLVTVITVTGTGFVGTEPESGGAYVLRPSNGVASFSFSMLSPSAVNLPYYDRENRETRFELKWPLTVAAAELQSYRALNPDHRAAGFGPWIGAAFLMAAMIYVGIGASRSPRVVVGLTYALSMILGTVVLFPLAFWARFVPQAWLLPVSVAAVAAVPEAPSWLRRAGLALVAVLLVNVAFVASEHVRGQIAIQSALRRSWEVVARLPHTPLVDFSNHTAGRLRFAARSLDYIDGPVDDCPYRFFFVRSGVAVCLGDSLEARGVRRALRAARRIRAELVDAGLGEFRVFRVAEVE